jgi:hypothetical protein
VVVGAVAMSALDVVGAMSLAGVVDAYGVVVGAALIELVALLPSAASGAGAGRSVVVVVCAATSLPVDCDVPKVVVVPVLDCSTL